MLSDRLDQMPKNSWLTRSTVVTTLAERLYRYLMLPRWIGYRLKNGKRPRHSLPSESTDDQVQQALRKKETFLRTILTQNAQNGRNRFLEIGIGELPNIERLEFMQQLGVEYTGADFKSVCDNHARELRQHGIAAHPICLVPNKAGTYAWTLFEMLSQGRTFDVIYLDGHHTFYVDLPAVFEAHLLLRPGGYLLIDDIQWTLTFLESNLFHRYHEWRFYRKMYDFSQYEDYQKDLPHIKMIVEEILVSRLGYTKLEQYSIPEWWALQKTN